jgi:CRISPR-associated protein Csb1
MSLSYRDLQSAVSTCAAIRRRQRLQPVGGKNDKIFPPTYPAEADNSPPVHVLERRRVGGESLWCVLIDSVQSQANRLEESLLAAVHTGAIEVPYIEVDFRKTEVPDVGCITSLEAPHRVYDAILRDSLLNGTPFMQSAAGVRLKQAKPNNAAALLEISPTALLFGAWHSQGEGGGFGAKFPRCVVSEIVGVNVPVEETVDRRTGQTNGYRTTGRRTGSRIDPLGILRKVPVYQGPNGWSNKPEEAGKGAKQIRPSEINHGNIAPSVEPLGVTVDYAEQTTVISFAGLRRLGFGKGANDAAARGYLAALGLLAVVEQDVCGYALRSRCDLVPEMKGPWELVQSDGTVSEFEIDLKAARTCYGSALKAAKDAGFELQLRPTRLVPQPKLVAIVRQSQDRALAGDGGEQAGAN